MRLLLILLLLGTASWGQDYFSNQGPVQASQPTGARSAGSLWQVVAGSLNGRATPTAQGRVVRVFGRGTVLQADIGRGGSDEVLRNAVDSEGHPWMRVRTREGQDLNCYVRANGRFIRPVEPPPGR